MYRATASPGSWNPRSSSSTSTSRPPGRSTRIRSLSAQSSCFLAKPRGQPPGPLPGTLASDLAAGHPPGPAHRFPLRGGNWSLEASLDSTGNRLSTSRAAGCTFVFVGTSSWKTMRTLVERYLAAGLPAGTAREWRTTGLRPSRGIVRRTVRRRDVGAPVLLPRSSSPEVDLRPGPGTC